MVEFEQRQSAVGADVILSICSERFCQVGVGPILVLNDSVPFQPLVVARHQPSARLMIAAVQSGVPSRMQPGLDPPERKEAIINGAQVRRKGRLSFRYMPRGNALQGIECLLKVAQQVTPIFDPIDTRTKLSVIPLAASCAGDNSACVVVAG